MNMVATADGVVWCCGEYLCTGKYSQSMDICFEQINTSDASRDAKTDRLSEEVVGRRQPTTPFHTSLLDCTDSQVVQLLLTYVSTTTSNLIDNAVFVHVSIFRWSLGCGKIVMSTG